MSDTGKFNRPWEASDDDGAEVVPLPGVGDDDSSEMPEEFALPLDELASVATDESEEAVDGPEAEASTAGEEDDDVDWDAMSRGGSLEDFTSEEYLSATTLEYQGLAEEISRAAGEQWEQQAVSVPVAGVGSGLVGFEDVSGAAGVSEESIEALEQAAASDLARRVASGLVIFAMFLGSLLLGGWWFTVFVILVMMVSVGEFYATLRVKGHKPLALFGLLGVILVGAGAHIWGVPAIGAWVGIASLVTLLFVSLTPRRNPLEDTSVTILGLAWVSMLSFAIPFAASESPVAWVMFVVLLVALNDMGAYFVGRAFGRNRLAPRLSEKKTIEGFFGGLLVAAMAASILVTFPAWESIGLGRALVLAGIVGLFTPLGDLAESMVKRSIDVKDMGSVLPGHGGMLDRIDGFLFALPALYFAFVAFGLL